MKPSFPTRRSSDLEPNTLARNGRKTGRRPEHIRPITDSGATLHRMIAKPAGKLHLRQCASGKGDDYLNGIPLVEHEFNLIHREEEAGSNPSSSLVTIHKRMIAGDAVSVSCG